MITFSAAKDPDDIDDFTFDWVSNLGSGETISTFSPAVITDGITIESSAINGSKTTCRLSGGIEGTKHEVLYRIITSTGRQLDETARVPVKTR